MTTTTDTTQVDFAEFAREIAAHLGYELVEQDDDRRHRAEIQINEAGCSITLWNRGRGDRVEVNGNYPRVATFYTPRDWGAIPYDDKPPEIGCSIARGSQAVAKDIARRFLPKYLPIFDVCVVKAQEWREQQSETKTTGEQLAAILNQTAHFDERGAESRFSVSIGDLYGHCSVSHSNVSIEVRHLTVEQAQRLLEVLANTNTKGAA